MVCIVSSTECTIVIIQSIECVEKVAHSIEWLHILRIPRLCNAFILRIPRLRNAFYRMRKFLDWAEHIYHYDMMLINNVLSPITLNDYLLYLSLQLLTPWKVWLYKKLPHVTNSWVSFDMFDKNNEQNDLL